VHRLTFFAALLSASAASAQTPSFTSLTVSGTANLGGINLTGLGTYTGSGSATPANQANQWSYTYTASNPTGEARPFRLYTIADYTGAATSSVTLGLDSELRTHVGIYPFGSPTFNPQGAGGGEHQSALYGYSVVDTSPAMYGCTPGTNCPGTIYATNGVNAFAANSSTAELFSARSFIAHTPQPSNSFTVSGYSAGNGGTTDVWSAYSSDDCRSGIDAAQCVGIVVSANSPYQNNGFGAASPIAQIHARCGNRTDTATGWVSGNSLYLATAPTVSLAMGPGNVVTAAGMTAAHLMAAASSAPTAGVTPGGFFAYTIDGSTQTVGSQASPVTFTFTETCIGLVVNNFSSPALATIGFISGTGQVNALLASIDQGSDSIAPLGTYLDMQINGVPSVYVYGVGGSRPAGMLVGWTTPPGTSPLDNLWVHGTMQADELILNSTGVTSLNTTGNVGIGLGRVAVGNRLTVQGVDTTSSNFALFVTDSAAAVLFQVRDDGAIIVSKSGVLGQYFRASVAAPIAGTNQITYGSTTSAASSCGSLTGAAGCLIINVAGTPRNIPFY
jgi:hypothetical protein